MHEPALRNGVSALRSARRVAALATAVLAGVTARPLLRGIPEVEALAHTQVHWAVVSTWTALAGALLVSCSAGPASAPRALARACGFGVLLGVLDAGLSYASLAAMRDGFEVGPFCGNVLLGMMGGSFAGGVRGLGFGLAVAPLVCQIAVSARSVVDVAAASTPIAAVWATTRRPERSLPRI